MLRKFEQFITISLAAALLFKCTGVNELFLCTFELQYPRRCSNECCGQTALDEMLKFLEQVKLGVTSIAVNLKTAYVRKHAQNLEKRPRTQFWPKNVNFQENIMSNFHATFKEYSLTSFACI